MTSAAALLTGLFLSAGLLQKDTDLKRLQGEWLLASTADERRADAGSPGMRMEIGEDGTFVYRLEELVTNRGTIRLSTAGKRKQLDLTLEDGRIFLGVYEVKGGCFKVCFSEPGQARPECIRPKGKQWAENWKRP